MLISFLFIIKNIYFQIYLVLIVHIFKKKIFLKEILIQ
jgi:hypothetical protein